MPLCYEYSLRVHGMMRLQDERDSLSESLASCRAQLSALREAHERGLLEVQAAAKTQAAEAHEERAREKAALKDLHER